MCWRALEESGLPCRTIVQLITLNWTHVQTLSPVISPPATPAATVPASRNDGSGKVSGQATVGIDQQGVSNI